VREASRTPRSQKHLLPSCDAKYHPAMRSKPRVLSSSPLGRGGGEGEGALGGLVVGGLDGGGLGLLLGEALGDEGAARTLIEIQGIW
jgi:hypothetical protein